MTSPLITPRFKPQVMHLKPGQELLSLLLSYQEVQYFLQQGADPNADFNGYSSLHAAIPGGRTFIANKIALLLDYGANSNKVCRIKGYEFGTFLHVIIANENIPAALESIKLVKDKFDASLTDGEGKTILITAVKAFNVPIATEIIKTFRQKAVLNHADEDGRTALHYAYAYGLSNLAKMLFAAGASRDICDKQGKKPQDYLYTLEEQDVVNMLRSIEIHPDRDVSVRRNAITDWAYIPILINGTYVLATVDNLRIHGHNLHQEYYKKGIASTLFRHSIAAFRTDTTAQQICQAKGEPENISIHKECGITFEKWKAEMPRMAGFSLISGIRQLRARMRLDSDLNPVSGIPVAPGAVFAPSV